MGLTFSGLCCIDETNKELCGLSCPFAKQLAAVGEDYKTAHFSGIRSAMQAFIS